LTRSKKLFTEENAFRLFLATRCWPAWLPDLDRMLITTSDREALRHPFRSEPTHSSPGFGVICLCLYSTWEIIANMAQTNANLIWRIADLLRGPYQPNQYGDVILPFIILGRLDCTVH
jgi:hypothetical protein